MSILRSDIPRSGILALCGTTLCLALAVSSVRAQCVGDCDDSGVVGINELILGVNIALDNRPIGACRSFDCESTGTVPVSCLIQGVNDDLNGCPNCPLAAGNYTFTLGQEPCLPFVPPCVSLFPSLAGATLVDDVGPGDANCVHDVVVPFPGGFTLPVFCVPALGYLVTITQTGCGVGQIDSNGGSDYTVTELGDTSDSSSTCNIPQMCVPGQDESVRIDINVGDGIPDTCSGGGMANVITSVPVDTLIWQDNSPGTFPPGCAGNSCTACGGDGVFNGSDLQINEFSQILDFTTDSTTATWVDLDGDGCFFTGAGPTSLSGTGVCMNLDTKTVTLVAAGTIGASAQPDDVTYLETAPTTFERTGDLTGAACDMPPAIDFSGQATRCIK